MVPRASEFTREELQASVERNNQNFEMVGKVILCGKKKGYLVS